MLFNGSLSDAWQRTSENLLHTCARAAAVMGVKHKEWRIRCRYDLHDKRGLHTTTEGTLTSSRGGKLDLVECHICYSSCNKHYDTHCLACIRSTVIRAPIQTSSEAESPYNEDRAKQSSQVHGSKTEGGGCQKSMSVRSAQTFITYKAITVQDFSSFQPICLT